MNEKTTLYLEPDLKQNVQIELVKEGEHKSLSALVNELLNEWYRNRKTHPFD